MENCTLAHNKNRYFLIIIIDMSILARHFDLNLSQLPGPKLIKELDYYRGYQNSIICRAINFLQCNQLIDFKIRSNQLIVV